MDRINELLQATLDLRNESRALLNRQASGQTLSDAERRRSEELFSRLIPAAEQAHADEQKRLNAEDARLRQRASATGRTSLGVPFNELGAGNIDVAEESATALPPLPERTRAALARLYPLGSAMDAEQRAEAWSGCVTAALGGNPFHHAIRAASQTEGVPSDGGFLVVTEVASGIVVRAAEESVFLRIGARLEPMTSDSKIVNALDDADESNDSEAAVAAEWTDEATEAEAQVVKFRQVQLKARKLLVLAAASNELAEDAPQAIIALEGALSRAIAKKFDRAVLVGPGAGSPLGILNSAAAITVAKEGGQAAASICWENVTKMWARLAPGSHERAWWLAHPTTLPQLLTLVLVIGTGGTQPRQALEPGGPTGLMMLGRPLLVTSRVKALGTKGDLILVDPTQLAIGIRRGVTIQRSEQALFSSDRLAIRGKLRGDARPLWEKVQTLNDGTNTVSPFVVLEARS